MILALEEEDMGTMSEYDSRYGESILMHSNVEPEAAVLSMGNTPLVNFAQGQTE